MNAFTLTVDLRPADDDPEHDELAVASVAWAGSPAVAEVDDATVHRARVWAAGTLARLEVLARQHIEAEARDHHCRGALVGEPLGPVEPTRQGFVDGCGITGGTTLRHADDWGSSLELTFTVPRRRGRAWKSALRAWLSELAEMDRPPAWVQVGPHNQPRAHIVSLSRRSTA